MAVFKESFSQEDRSGSYDYEADLRETGIPGKWKLTLEVTRDDLGWTSMYEENADSISRDRPVESLTFQGTLQEITEELVSLAKDMVSGFRKFQPGIDGDKEHWRWCDRNTPRMIMGEIAKWITDESKEEEEE